MRPEKPNILMQSLKCKKNILEKRGVSAYIAERQAEIEKQAGRDIMSLTEIQVRRSKIANGLLTDSFGFAPDFPTNLRR